MTIKQFLFTTKQFNLNNKNYIIFLFTTILLMVYNFFIVAKLTEFFQLKSLSVKTSNNYYDDFTFVVIFIFIGLLGPIYEEIVYRYFLNQKSQLFYSGFFLLIVNIVSQAHSYLTRSLDVIVNFGIPIALGSLVYILLSKFKEIPVPKNFRIFAVVISILLFSIGHSAKYDLSVSPKLTMLTIFVVLLQFIPTSLFFTFLRFKFKEGFKAAVLAHCMYNSIVVILLYISMRYLRYLLL